MQGLYKCVTKGIYPNIPGHFSSEIGNLVKILLVV